MTGRRIGILGGTFDPIHCGHIETGAAAEAALRLTRIYVMPSNLPWHRRPPKASAFHRFAMVSFAVAGRKGWRAADLELRGDGESYTYRTLQKLHGRGYAPEELFFIVGADAFVDIQTWRQFPAVLEYAHFAVVSRPGLPVTELRRRLPDLAERMIEPSADLTIQSGPRVVLIDAATPSQMENQNASVNCLAAKKEPYQRNEKPVGGKERYSAALTDVRITIAVGSSRNT